MSAEAADFVFTTIADSSGEFAAFSKTPALNNAGQAVFLVTFDSSSHKEIRVDDGVSFTVIASTASGAGFSNFYGEQSINNNGSVAFYGYSTTDGVGIFSGDGTGITTIANIFGEFGGYNTYDPPGINDDGLVAFHGKPQLSSPLYPEGIFTGSGGPVSVIANVNFSNFSGKVSINNSGKVLFRASLTTDDVTFGGIFVGSGGGSTTTIADTLGVFGGFAGASLSESGLVGFVADYAGGDGVYTGDGTTTTTIVESTDSPYSDFTNEVAINASGDLVFRANLDAGGSGLFCGPDPVADKVIMTGDALLGSTVQDVHIQVESLNDLGQIAFWVSLSDGTEAIVLADPQPAFLEVAIDIKPGSDPNCINNDGNGVIPVAILGSAEFDVNSIDPATVMLEGLAVRVAGKSNKLLAHIEDVNSDGFDDLVCQVEDFDGVFELGDESATLTGELYDGTPITGTDSICIVPPQ